MNKGFCNACGQMAVAETQEKNGKVYLVKNCPACGPTETLIASDARRFQNKHQLDHAYEYQHCHLNCTRCKHKDPNMVFIDITNRCNMNCPICINNTPSMGFLFEPPLDYFDKIFKHLATITPKPVVQLFGGEPTVHRQLFEIIALARDQRLSVRVVTNGLKLADEAYCRRLIETRATILIAYDGDNPELYTTLRGSKTALALKLKAFENIGRINGAKVAIMSLVAKGYNEHGLGRLFEFCHEHRANVRGVYLMPLAHTWVDGKFDKEPDRITPEDLETVVSEVFPQDPIDFIPAGFMGLLPNYIKYLRVRRLPFVGAHPNCESFYLLVSDGQKFQPVSRFLKQSTLVLCQDLLESDKRVGRTRTWLNAGLTGRLMEMLRIKRPFLFLRTIFSIANVLRRQMRLDRVFKGGGIAGRLFNMARLALGLALRRNSAGIVEKTTHLGALLQVIVLPFEDRENMETDRLERCPAAFAYVEPEGGQVKHVPACAWGLFKTDTLHRIAEHYKEAPTLAEVSNGKD